jgi:RNA polymerase sigma factor (sigma-70 family)
MSKILIVDDDPAIVEGLLMCFELESIAAAGASDRMTAQAMLEEAYYPIVLADLRLTSEAEGLRLLESIRTISPATRVATLTGHATPEMERQLGELGSRLVLYKPVSADVVIAAVRDMLVDIEAAEQKEAFLDDAAIEALYQSTRRVLFGISTRRYGMDAADAEELIQEAWCLYLQKRLTIRAAKPWLAGTIVNLCRQEITRRARHDQVDESFDEMSMRSHSDDAMIVDQALGRIDERSRSLIRMISLENRSYEEVSRASGLPVGSIGPMLIRAKTKLRSALAGSN